MSAWHFLLDLVIDQIHKKKLDETTNSDYKYLMFSQGQIQFTTLNHFILLPSLQTLELG